MIEPDQQFEPIRKACKQLAGNIVRLKEQHADVLDAYSWKDGGLKKAWRKLNRAIERYVPQGTKWCGFWIQFAIEDAWRGPDQSPDAIAKFLELKVKNTLQLDMNAEWVAFTPLGRQFSGFPQYTDFGHFEIVNVSASAPHEAAARFRSILEGEIQANFVASEEVDSPYHDNVPKLTARSFTYFPMRSQLLLRLGRGLTMQNFHDLQDRLHRLTPLILLSEIAAEMYYRGDTHDAALDWPLRSDAGATLPDGSPMPQGLIRVPDFAVLLNVHLGDVWSAGPYFQRSPDFGTLPIFETNRTLPLTVDAFRAAWKQWGWTLFVVLQAMEEAQANTTFRYAIEGSIQMIAQCRHWRGCRVPDPNLYGVIATETLLNPFRKQKIEERFAKFGAALCEADPSSRSELESRLTELYEQRCDYVHASIPFCDSDERCDDLVSQRNPEFALKHYFKCLHHVSEWTSNRLENSQPLSENAFEKWYRSTTGCS